MKQTQQQKLLNALKQGPVNSYKATYEMSIKQAPTRIKELRDEGFNITSLPEKDRSVTWVLSSDTVGRVPEPRLEDQYIFLPSGRAVPREDMEPRQEVML